MKCLDEFKTFALRGNMVDLAIGVIIGAAFGKVVSSLVGDVIMPPIGLVLGGVDFSSLAFTLKAATPTSAAVVIKYGLFINTLIDFTIIAAAIFAVIKVVNRIQPPKEVEVTTKPCSECFMLIPKQAKKCGHCCSTLKD